MNQRSSLQSALRQDTNALPIRPAATPGSMPRRLLASLLEACVGGAAAQESIDRCVLCVQFNDAATYSFSVTDPGQAAIPRTSGDQRLSALMLAFERVPGRRIEVNSSKDGMTVEKVLESVRRNDVVCDGVSLPVDVFRFSTDTVGVGLAVPAMPQVKGTLCIGTVTTVNEFRERPYRKFFDAEKKTMLDRLTGIEQLASKDTMRATLKDLLDTDLKAQRAVMVSEVAAEAVRLLEQPVSKKK